MKKLPNLITGARILMAAALVMVKPLGWAFFVLYLLGGLSDLLDGYLARRLSAQTELGAKLDAFADLTFIAATVFSLWSIVAPPVYIIIWFFAIFLVKLAAAIIGKLRFGVFSFLHTLANKLTGAALFVYPLTLFWLRSEAIMAALCALASIAALEELAICLSARSFNADRPSLFWRETSDA